MIQKFPVCFVCRNIHITDQVYVSVFCIVDVMKHPFMTKESSSDYTHSRKNLAEVSIDSGRGTMSTGIMSRMSSVPKQRPVQAIHHIQSNIPEDRENSVGDRSADGYYSSGNMAVRKDLAVISSPAFRHGVSTPVRQQGEDQDVIFPDKYGTPKPELKSSNNTPRINHHERFFDSSDRTPKTNPAEFVNKGGDTGYCSANRNCNHSETETRSYSSRNNDMPRLNLAQFDPAKYQERLPTQSTSSSGWSCSASMHSNEAKVSPRSHTDTSAQDAVRRQASTCISAVSDASSCGEFSLQKTKKVLDFESVSQPTSLNEHYSHPGEVPVSVSQHSHTNSVSAEFSNQRMYARSNSVDELELDRPRHKAVAMRSNSCDDLDSEDPRDFSHKPVSLRTQELTDLNCASALPSDGSSEINTVSSKQQSDLGSPINSSRLRPIRQRTRNAVVNIMENGEVCLEFVKQKHKEEKVVEVFVISSDGLQVGSVAFLLLLVSFLDFSVVTLGQKCVLLVLELLQESDMAFLLCLHQVTYCNKTFCV